MSPTHPLLLPAQYPWELRAITQSLLETELPYSWPAQEPRLSLSQGPQLSALLVFWASLTLSLPWSTLSPFWLKS